MFGGGVSVVGTLTSPSFAKFMSISAKTSFPVMAGLGLFTYGYEVSMHDAMRCAFYCFSSQFYTLFVAHIILFAVEIVSCITETQTNCRTLYTALVTCPRADPTINFAPQLLFWLLTISKEFCRDPTVDCSFHCPVV